MASKNNKNNNARKSTLKPRYLFLGLGVLGLGVVSYLGYRYWKDRQEEISVDISPKGTKLKSSTKTTSKRKWIDDSFPLSFNSITNTGSSGPKVLQLQQKLNTKHDAGLVADGKFGPMTRDALLVNGYSPKVEMDTFNKIVDDEPTLVFDPKRIADLLWRYSNSANIDSTLAQLRQIKDTDDYQSVGTIFKTFRDASDYFHSHTIVTHLLDFAFKENESARSQIKKEFSRMGLVERSGKWSLSGFGRPARLVTLKHTYVRDLSGNIVEVKKNTILGIQQYSTQGLTWFMAIDGSMAAVPSRDVKTTN